MRIAVSGGAKGISGYHGGYLNLTQAGTVNFQFMGKGDATDRNVFQLFLGGAWATIWDTQGSNGTCGASGSATPSIDCSPVGSSYSNTFAAGLIPFQFVNLTTPGTATNDGSGNPGHEAAGYFLGIDPYLAGYSVTSGSAAYIGFTDRGCTPGGACDHDYEDLIVRASVPEPGTVFLLGIGMMGLAGSLRRRKV